MDEKWPGSNQSVFELLGKRKEVFQKNFSIFISCVRNPFGVPSFREIDFLTRRQTDRS